MTKRALVLAGGGLAGIAWQTGILRGITDEARGGPARGDVAGNRRLLRWLDIHMGPVTWQVLDQVGHKSALRLLRRAHATAGHVFLDSTKFRADPTRDDYRPPE